MPLLALVLLLQAAAPVAAGGRPEPQAPCFDQREESVDGSWMCTVDLGDTSGTEGEIGILTTYSKWKWAHSWIVYYGIGSQTIGSVRETAQVLLNGRRSDVNMTIQWWSGPAIKGKITWQCIKDNFLLPDSVCKSGEVASTTYRTTSLSNSGYFYHSADDRYFYRFYWEFWAQGKTNPSSWNGAFYSPVESSDDFHCSSGYPVSEVCRFY